MTEGIDSLNTKTPPRSWSERNHDLDRDWEIVLDTLIKDYCAKSSFVTSRCTCCNLILDQYVIRCNCCKAKYCAKCDNDTHSVMPFHDRWNTIKNKWINLLPNEFLNEEGEIIIKG